MNKFSFNNPIFREKRMLNFAGGVDTLDVAKMTPKQKALELLKKIHKANALEGGDRPDSILANNPYSHLIISVAEKFSIDDIKVDDSKISDGKLIITSKGKTVVLDKLTFAAIQWRMIDKRLSEMFKGKNITKKLIQLGIKEKNPQLQTLILSIVGNPGFNDPAVIEATRKALDKLRPKLAPGATRARVKVKGKIDRTKAKPVKLPTKPKGWTNKSFLEKFEDRKKHPNTKIDKLKMNIYREGKQINVQKWEFASEAGIAKIYRDCKDLGLPINSPLYRFMFATMKQATDPSKNTHLGDSTYQNYFQDPANNINNIETLPDCRSGFSPAAFSKAFQHLKYVQGLALAQDKWQKLTQGKQEALGSSSIARKITDGLKANYNKLADAVRTGDYATAGMYAVIGWALWKSAKESGWFGKDGKGTKYLAYTIAAGGLLLIGKNAGYDFLKMAGFRDKTFEVKGTPLEVIDSILKANPQHRELAKDIDYGVVIQASDIPLRDLEKEFQKTNKANGIQFISPHQFPKIFPKLAGLWPFKMGIGEEAMGGDYAGMNKAKLSADQREFIRVGQQLYKVALAMRAVYNDTLRKDHPNYKGIPYEKMLLMPGINPGKVRHLMAAVYDYAPSRPKRSLTSTKAVDEATAHLNTFFKDKDVGFHLERQVGKSGHFIGKLMGYPVVFVRTKNGYRVYLKPDYRSKFSPGPTYIAEIPITAGSAQNLEVNKAIKGVKNRIVEILSYLQGAGGKSLLRTSLKYKLGEWTCDVNLPGAAEYDISARKTRAIIKLYPDGKGAYLKVEGGVVINVNESLAKRFPVAIALIPRIIDQPEYKCLGVFNYGNQIKIRDKVQGDKKFMLKVGRRQHELRFTYDSATKKFKLDPADEKKILKDPGFALDYIEALQANPTFELNQTVKDLKEAITTSPEDFFKNVWAKLTKQTLDPQMDGINLSVFSGSVPDYLSNTVIDVVKYEALNRLRRRMHGATSLAQIAIIQSDVLDDVNSRLKGVSSMLKLENQNIPSWKRAEYMNRILFPIRRAGAVSSEYRRMKGKMEYDTYKLMGVMRSDLSVAPHKTAGTMMKVYAYYTSHLDNHKFYDPIAKKMVPLDLDKLDSPPKATYSASKKCPPHQDPGLRGWGILQYMKYVQAQVITKSRSKKLKNLPDGSARTFWNIMEFDVWVKSGHANFNVLDKLDKKPAYEHNPSLAHPAFKLTELEKAIKKEFLDARDYLKRVYGRKYLNFREIDAYLLQKAGAVPAHRVGILKAQKVGSVYRSKLWDIANSVAVNKRRSQQIRDIQQVVDDELIKFIFRHPRRFFKKKPPIKARMLRRWPWLARIPIIF